MQRVKICGLIRIEDVLTVNELMPDYAGFVFAKGKHQLTLKTAISLCEKLDSKIEKVGVFVNEEGKKIIEIINECHLDIVQLCGDEGQEMIDDIKTKAKVEVWKAIKVQDKADLLKMNSITADAFLLDTYVRGQYGGSGQCFDWDLAKEAKGRIILAGGLTPENVAKAVRTVNPYAVDVSSGVETKGAKDYNKIKAFIANIRRI